MDSSASEGLFEEEEKGCILKESFGL